MFANFGVCSIKNSFNFIHSNSCLWLNEI